MENLLTRDLEIKEHIFECYGVKDLNDLYKMGDKAGLEIQRLLSVEYTGDAAERGKSKWRITYI